MLEFVYCIHAVTFQILRKAMGRDVIKTWSLASLEVDNFDHFSTMLRKFEANLLVELRIISAVFEMNINNIYP